MEGLVEITLNGCYTHSDNFEGTPRRSAVLDQAMSALLTDLHPGQGTGGIITTNWSRACWPGRGFRMGTLMGTHSDNFEGTLREAQNS